MYFYFLHANPYTWLLFIIINTLFEIGKKKNLHSSAKNLQSNLYQKKKKKNNNNNDINK